MIRETSQNGSAPIFILGSPRSGSTLLRYILDTHPDICCPGELELGQLCRRLVQVHFYTTGQVYAEAGENEVRERIYQEARRIAGGIMESYATAKKKKRWCEKSSANLYDIDLLTRLFPAAKYICLHRHCMDMVYSLLEASRFGYKGVVAGYIQRNPRNIVTAMAEYWCDYTEELLKAEQQYSDRCFRVKYESLVMNPSSNLAELFSFLNAEWVERIADEVFSTRHDAGPGDIKVSFSKNIHTNSIGKGIRLDGNELGNVRERVNRLLSQLDYPLVDSEWRGGLLAGDDENNRDAEADILEIFTKHFPQRLLLRKDGVNGIGARLKIVVTGEAGGIWVIDFTDAGRIKAEDGNSECTITIRSGDLIEMAAGKLNPAEALLQGRLHAAGDVRIAKAAGEILFGA